MLELLGIYDDVREKGWHLDVEVEFLRCGVEGVDSNHKAEEVSLFCVVILIASNKVIKVILSIKFSPRHFLDWNTLSSHLSVQKGLQVESFFRCPPIDPFLSDKLVETTINEALI